MASIFQDPTKSLPKKDEQIIRVDMETQEIGGRKEHLPKSIKSDKLAISHVPNAGGKH